MNKEYQPLMLYGIKHGVPRPKNLAKLCQVVQGKSEDPSALNERLCETARKWADMYPEDEASSKTFTTLFARQLPPDIRRKLQTVDGMSGTSISQLTEIAYKVYNNRKELEKKEKQKEKLKDRKRNAAILAAVFAQALISSQGRGFLRRQGCGRGRGAGANIGNRIPLGRDQWVICKKKGHWKNECLKRQPVIRHPLLHPFRRQMYL